MSFEMVTPEDWENLMSGNVVNAGDKPVVFLGIVGLRDIKNQQLGAIEALNKAVQEREAQADAIRRDDLTSAKAKAAAFEKLDEKYAAEIADYMAAIVRMAADAQTQKPFWTRPAALQRCKFFDADADAEKNAVVRSDLARRVARMPHAGLMDLARMAVALQNGGDRKTGAAMVAVIAEELDARTVPGGSRLSVDNAERRALSALMDQVDCFDREGRYIIESMDVSAREAALLGGGRKGMTVERISTGLQRANLDQMPAK